MKKQPRHRTVPCPGSPVLEAPDHEKMGKGISLTKEELEALYDLIGEDLGK